MDTASKKRPPKNYDYLDSNFAIFEMLIKESVNKVPGHIYWKDTRGKYLGSNRQQLKTLGLESLDDIIGKTDFELPWPPNSAETYRNNDNHVVKTGETISTVEYIALENKIVPTLSIKTPLYNSDKVISGVFGFSVLINGSAEPSDRTAKFEFKKSSSVLIDTKDELRIPSESILYMIENFA